MKKEKTPYKLILKGWGVGAKKVSATKYIQTVSDLTLSESKHAVDNALDNIPTTFKINSNYNPSAVIEKLNGYGFICEKIKSY